MENASKALIIAGAILLSILIIAIGIYIFNGANSTVVNSMQSMTTSEIEAFNNQFLSYDGKQSGSNVKALIGRLIANANTYKEEYGKVPTIRTSANGVNTSKSYASSIFSYPLVSDTNLKNYIEGLANIRNNLENKHEYTIELIFGSSGIISNIGIKYDPTDIISY